jgi:hypothetical protein
VATYLTGKEALADARLRSGELGSDHALVFVEGRDDVRLLAPYSLGLELFIPCGNKRKLLEAYAGIEDGEESRFLFIADCDYDVPAGALAPQQSLLLTNGVDVEADLFGLGVLEALVLELVPPAVSSPAALDVITQSVRERVLALAEAIGRFRQLSAVSGLGIAFGDLKYHKYRLPGTAQVDEDKLARVLLQSSGIQTLDAHGLLEQAREIPCGITMCHGADILGSLAAVLHKDFNVPIAVLRQLPSLLRASTTAEQLERWEVVRRIRRWEQRHGRCLLRPSSLG